MRVSASSCTQSGAAAVSQKATFSQNQPNNLKLMALTVVPTKTPAMLEHGFKLCMFVGVACRYLLQDHRDPLRETSCPQKLHRVRRSLEGKCLTELFETLKRHFLHFSITCIHCLSRLLLLYTSPVGKVYSPVSLTSYMESCAAALMIIMFL